MTISSAHLTANLSHYFSANLNIVQFTSVVVEFDKVTSLFPSLDQSLINGKITKISLS